jgi:hypothetical protein
MSFAPAARYGRMAYWWCLLICKICYLISRTVSEDNGHRDAMHDRSVRAFAVKPRAFGAPSCGLEA